MFGVEIDLKICSQPKLTKITQRLYFNLGTLFRHFSFLIKICCFGDKGKSRRELIF